MVGPEEKQPRGTRLFIKTVRRKKCTFWAVDRAFQAKAKTKHGTLLVTQ